MRLAAAITAAALVGANAVAGGRLVGNFRGPGGGGIKEHWFYIQREGTTCTAGNCTPDDGRFDLFLTPGRYCIFDREYYADDLIVPEGGVVRHPVRHWADFWTSSGDYMTGHTFEQTFVARGRSVRRVWLDVGNFDRVYLISFHEGGPGGPQVGIIEAFHSGTQRGVGINYVYGAVPLIPGRVYCMKVVSDIGAVISMETVDKDEYRMGQLCIDGVPQPGLDLRAEINVDRTGVMTTHQYIGGGGSGTTGREFAQTFIAQGHCVVAAMVLGGYGGEPSPIGMEVTVLEGDAYGPEMGPRKSIGGLEDWVHGVGWLVGECPITPGQTYYLRWTRRYGEQWFLGCYGLADQWADGMAWRDRDEPHPEREVFCWIIEHTGEDPIDLTEVRAESDASGDVTVRWTTPVACSSQVEHWFAGEPHEMTALDETNVTEHEVSLSGLPVGESLHYIARCWASGWLESESAEFVVPTGAGGTRSFGLNAGWSLIGYASGPLTAPALAECRVSDGSQVREWDEAVAAGWVQNGLFYYDGASYKLVKTSGGDCESLASGSGYWVLNESGVPLSLLVP